MSENNFYFWGKWFSTFEEMIDYEKIWRSEKLTEQTAIEILRRLDQDILMNIFMRNTEFTNRQFLELSEKLFKCSLTFLHEVEKND